MIDKIPVKPHGFGDQLSYKGITLGQIEQAMLEKLHELIDDYNTHKHEN